MSALDQKIAADKALHDKFRAQNEVMKKTQRAQQKARGAAMNKPLADAEKELQSSSAENKAKMKKIVIILVSVVFAIIILMIIIKAVRS